LIRAAGVFQSAKNFRAAVRVYRQVLELTPADAKIERMLADALSWNAEYPESLRLFRALR
ncbi:MAG: hypothetical protein ACRC7O_03370, partial [Fimbriiglobus sp.]